MQLLLWLPLPVQCSADRWHLPAAVGMQIEEGHYGKVNLDGLRWAAIAAWPGPIHMGHGEIQPIVVSARRPSSERLCSRSCRPGHRARCQLSSSIRIDVRHGA